MLGKFSGENREIPFQRKQSKVNSFTKYSVLRFRFCFWISFTTKISIAQTHQAHIFFAQKNLGNKCINYN